MSVDVRRSGSDVLRACVLVYLLGQVTWVVLWSHRWALLVLVPEGFLAATAIRMFRVRVYSDGGRIFVRNVWVTFHLYRSEIDRFAVADRRDPWGKAGRMRIVEAHLFAGHARRIIATKRSYYRFWQSTPRPGARTRADDFGVELNAWLAAPT